MKVWADEETSGEKCRVRLPRNTLLSDLSSRKRESNLGRELYRLFGDAHNPGLTGVGRNRNRGQAKDVPLRLEVWITDGRCGDVRERGR